MHTNPDVLALLALGEKVGTPSEHDHVATCEVCAREVADFQHLAEIGRTATDEDLHTPSPAVWDRIVAELGLGQGVTIGTDPAPDLNPITGATVHHLADRPRSDARRNSAVTPTTPGHPATPASGRSGLARALTLALAAVVALVVGIGIGVAIDRGSEPTAAVLGRATLSALPDFAGSSGEAVVEEDAQGNRVLVVTATASRTVTGHQEIWLLSSDAKALQNLGVLRAGENRVNLPPEIDLRELPVVDVSAEQNNGNPAHSGESIVRGTLSL